MNICKLFMLYGTVPVLVGTYYFLNLSKPLGSGSVSAPIHADPGGLFQCGSVRIRIRNTAMNAISPNLFAHFHCSRSAPLLTVRYASIWTHYKCKLLYLHSVPA